MSPTIQLVQMLKKLSERLEKRANAYDCNGSTEDFIKAETLRAISEELCAEAERIANL